MRGLPELALPILLALGVAAGCDAKSDDTPAPARPSPNGGTGSGGRVAAGGANAGGASAGRRSSGGTNAAGSDAGTGGDTGGTGGGAGGDTGGTGGTGGAGDAGGADTGAAGETSTSTPAESNPVTTPMTGSHATYDVGPGREYEEPDTVPWGALTAGDVVNIYWRDTPYGWKLCLRGQGTASAPIVVNGVTDDSGQRPRFDFDGARTASGCNPGGGHDVFDASSQYSLEDYAGIIVRDGIDDEWPYRPSFIVIKNLELTGAAEGNSFVNLAGDTTPYIDSPAAIWLQPSTDVTLENNVIHDHGFGVFTMAKDGSLDTACERIVLSNNRIWDNGVVGSYYEHNVYMQSTNPLVEGNYLGPTRVGSEGSSYKSRSSGEIFRYNYVEASARAIDWVHSEDQTPGIATQADYGTDYAYGNVIVNDCALTKCATQPIHYGGDNLGEQEDTATLFTPEIPYRAHLYFFNNSVVNRTTKSDAYRASVFDLSLRDTRVEAWNNVFFFEGDTNFSWLDSAGRLELIGTNLAFGATLTDASDQALADNYTVDQAGELLTSDPEFVAADDFHPGPTSGAVDAATGVPAGSSPGASYIEVPVAMEPTLRANGMTPRTRHGAELDLGAFEAF